jgi:hypothetical protein
MKDDQIIRAVGCVCIVAAYAVHEIYNGGGPVSLGALGTYSDYGFTIGSVVIIALPEIIDRLPVGPTRKK